MNHTLLLLTRNRPQWINYSLSFYTHYNYKGKIVIGDDSTEEYFNKNKEIITSYTSKLKIIHIKGAGRFLEKRHKRFVITKYGLLKNIDTEFYTHISDDDFFFPDFFYQGEKFLKENSEYSAVNGIGMIVYLDNNFGIKKINNLKWPNNIEKDPMDRLMRYITPSFATQPIMSVCRTESLKSLFKLEKVLNYEPMTRPSFKGLELFDEEIPWGAQILISGKVGSLSQVSQFVIKTETSDEPSENDRIENYKYNKSPEFKVFRLGNVVNLLDGSATEALNETKKELSELIKICGSKYRINEIDDLLSRFLWKCFKQFDGDTSTLITDFEKKDFINNSIRKKILLNIKFINFFYILKNPTLMKKLFRFVSNNLNKFIINNSIKKLKSNYSDFHNKMKSQLSSKTKI